MDLLLAGLPSAGCLWRLPLCDGYQHFEALEVCSSFWRDQGRQFISYQFSYRQRSSRSTARSDSVQHSVAAQARRSHSPNWFAYLVPFSTSQLFRSRVFVYFSSLPLSCLDDIISTRDGCFLGRRNEAHMLCALVTPLPFGFALLHI